MATIQHELAQGHGYAECEVGTQVTAYQLAIRVALRYWSARTTSVQDRLAETIPSLLLFMHHLFQLLFVSVSSAYQPPSHHRPFLSGRPPPSPWSLVAATGRGLVSPPCTASVYFQQNAEDVLNSPGDWAILVRPSFSPSSRLHQHLHRWYHREHSGQTSS
jgi:hypothetical protein